RGYGWGGRRAWTAARPGRAGWGLGRRARSRGGGGARMHCSVSGCGDILAGSDEEAIELCKRYLDFMPQSYRERPASIEGREAAPGRPVEGIVPYEQRKSFDVYEVSDRIPDAGSFFETNRHLAHRSST